jgi:hypothetical protein
VSRRQSFRGERCRFALITHTVISAAHSQSYRLENRSGLRPFAHRKYLLAPIGISVARLSPSCHFINQLEEIEMAIEHLTPGEIICRALQYLPANNAGFWEQCVAEAGIPAKASPKISAVILAMTEAAMLVRAQKPSAASSALALRTISSIWFF